MWKSLYEFFSYVAYESASSGKIAEEQQCPFCGSHLSEERLEGTRVRLGRLQFLMREAELGSPTAEELLRKIFVIKKYLGGIEIPENSPEWWDQKVLRIYQEEDKPKANNRI